MEIKARPDHELATILQHQRKALVQMVPNGWKNRTLFALSRCRTAEMGGHIDRCNNTQCNKLHLSYNSCRNRHCPKCQGHLKEQWIAAREAGLLQCKYFHVVFTIPEVLNQLVLEEPRAVYAILFKAAWQVLKGFGANAKFLGAQPGMISILHSWGQNMSLHPHLHCIVPAGGVTKSGKWKSTRSAGKFLFPVKSMSAVFRAKFVAELTKQLDIPDEVRKAVFAKKWVVYAKQPFYGPKQVIEYLGRYTHKIAISNHRIKAIGKGRVTFTAKDYKKGGKPRLITLTEGEFIRRFALHILPKGFTRIRHYGILSSSHKKKYKHLIDEQLGQVALKEKAPASLHQICPACKKGILETIYVFDGRGPPKDWHKVLQ